MKRHVATIRCSFRSANGSFPLVRSVCRFALLLAIACLCDPGNAFAQTDTPSAPPSRSVNRPQLGDRAHAGDWPRFLGENFDGVTTTSPESIDWTAAPQTVWSLSVADGYGIGSVADGRYFQFDAVVKPQGDPQQYQSAERLRAIDLATGEQLWASEQPFVYQDMLGYENGPRSSPTIDGDSVFTLGVTGRLTCRDVSDGTIRWTVDTNEAYGVVQNFFGVGASPLMLDGRLIVMVGGSPPEDQQVGPMQLDRVSPNGSAMVAFDPATGKELWRCGDDLASYSSPRPINVDGETLVIAFLRSGLMAVDPAAGKVRWTYKHRARILESVNAMMPVVRDNKVLISECYEVGSALLEVTAKQCKEVWKDPPRDRRAQSLRAHWATPVLVGDWLYGCSGRNAPDSDFRCIAFDTGEVMWSDPRRIRSSVTRVGDHLLVLEERGLMQVIKPDPAELKVVSEWNLAETSNDRKGLQYPCWAAPVVIGNDVLVRGTDQVLCLRFPEK
tara:strand:+ start:4575 stop:6074 length:1500 start_codon:yes stop_codon:yes gene_type:complete